MTRLASAIPDSMFVPAQKKWTFEELLDPANMAIAIEQQSRAWNREGNPLVRPNAKLGVGTMAKTTASNNGFVFRTRLVIAKQPGRCRGKAGGAEIFNLEYREVGGKWKLHSQYLTRGECNRFRHNLEEDARCGRFAAS